MLVTSIDCSTSMKRTFDTVFPLMTALYVENEESFFMYNGKSWLRSSPRSWTRISASELLEDDAEDSPDGEETEEDGSGIDSSLSRVKEDAPPQEHRSPARVRAKIPARFTIKTFPVGNYNDKASAMHRNNHKTRGKGPGSALLFLLIFLRLVFP